MSSLSPHQNLRSGFTSLPFISSFLISFIYLFINRKQSLFVDSQFRESGCENCPFLQMDEDQERVVECTTPNFNGYVFIISFYNKTLITFEMY
jgi:hypothetical protein